MRMNRTELPRFASKDLTGRREWPTSAAMLCTLVVVTAVCFASYSAVLGRWKVERQRIDREAWALVLRVGNSVTTRGMLKPRVLDLLRERLAARFADAPRAIRAIHPYRTCTDRIQLFVQRDRRVDLTGRTLYFDGDQPDLYLSGHPIAAPGRSLASASDQGILITPKGLEKLGLVPPPQPPFRVTAEVHVNMREIEVVGILADNLPDFYDFVLTESYERQLLHGAPELDHVLSGPMPDEWGQGEQGLDWNVADVWRSWPAEVVDKLDEVRLHDGRLRFQAKAFFDQRANTVRTALDYDEWRTLLQRVADEMSKRTNVPGPSFVEFKSDEPPDNSQEDAYDLVNVYVREADALTPAADICDEIVNFQGQGTVNRDVIRRLESIDLRLQDSMRTVNYQQAVVTLLSAFTLSVLQIFRAIGKTGEVGMLRAMGMTRRQVFGFIVLQAGLLAICGTALGITLGGVVTFLSSWSSHDSWELVVLGCGFDWRLPAYIGSGALVITLVSGLLAAWRWFLHEPARLMR